MSSRRSLMACRICLDTETRLFDIFKNKLAAAYSTVSILVSPKRSDGRPQYLCSYCSTMVMKCAKFHDLCNRSDDLLNATLQRKSTLTMDDVKKLNGKLMNGKFKTNLSLTTIDYIEITNDEVPEVPISNIKQEKQEMDELIDSDMPDMKEVKEDAIKNVEIDINCIFESPIFDNESDNEVAESKVKKEFDVQEVKRVAVKTKRNTKSKIGVKRTHGGHNKINLNLNEIEIVNLTEEDHLEEMEKRKKSYNYVNSLYKCDQCFKGYMTEATYGNHMLRHDPRSGAHVCPVCRTRFATHAAMRNHRVKMHDQKFVCKLCSKVTRSRSDAQEHNLWHHGKMHICKVCGKSFSEKTSHLTHLRIQHPSDARCEICGESFIGKYGLYLHMRKTHRDAKNLSKTCSETLCAQCEVQFSNVRALKAHTCDPDLSQCVKCGQGFDSSASLEAHSGECGGEESARVTYQCDQCAKTFTLERNLACHRLRHGTAHARGPAGGRTRGDVVKKVFVCEICGWSSGTKANIVYHQRTHTGEKPFQCPECPRRFRMKDLMQIHLRRHTGETPYKCKLCPKAFKDMSGLQRHMRVHTGAKPYACPHCGRTFSQSNSMKCHVNAVHLKIPETYRRRKRARPNVEAVPS